ncbi:uncharacterized protein [Leptinotarsa decemlineata]|uniref:uncharacterized protein n=1 Tax=Leptinotarsa decemlineata TaxID=7539 RepID=UPI000C252F3B|nr:uncharacterized protein LOC111511911 [Leptinotarsa decemlineata]
MDENTKKEIISCIEESMLESLSDLKIDFTGTNEKGEGYAADFVFATVSGKGENKEYKEVYLAIKFGKRSKELRAVILDCYRREAFFYDKVLSTFRDFQMKRNIVNSFSAFPKCYKIWFSDSLEALVLENLKRNGFALHDKSQPMNFQHIYLVLRSYAKFHALSFALRDQQVEKFNELTADYDSILKKMILGPGALENHYRASCDLREAGRTDLAMKCEEIENNRKGIFQECLDDVPTEAVITHGDCHNNNFLFEYEANDKDNPISVAIIDWQLSEIHSPVMDLSYFLYCVAPKEALAKLDVLLKYYHEHLTNFMRELGSDTAKLFPYHTLVKHWRKYSIFTFTFLVGVLKIIYVEKDHAPPTEGFQDMEKMFKGMKLTNEAVYRERLISVVDHFFNFILN